MCIRDRSYTVGVQQLLPGVEPRIALALFSLVFFGLVLFFSLRPGELLTWIGKVPVSYTHLDVYKRQGKNGR